MIIIITIMVMIIVIIAIIIMKISYHIVYIIHKMSINRGIKIFKLTKT